MDKRQTLEASAVAVLAYALYDSENITRLSELLQEDQEPWFAHARVLLHHLSVFGATVALKSAEVAGLVRELRKYEVLADLPSLPIHPETVGYSTGQVLGDTRDAAAALTALSAERDEWKQAAQVEAAERRRAQTARQSAEAALAVAREGLGRLADSFTHGWANPDSVHETVGSVETIASETLAKMEPKE